MCVKAGGDGGTPVVCQISHIMERFGRYQKVQYLWICLPAIFVTIININYIFVVGDVNYRCRVAECEGPESTVQEPSWWPSGAVDRCSRPVLSAATVNGSCTNTSFTTHYQRCTEWIYENYDTVVGELKLACEPWKISLIGAIHNMGMLVAMVSGGWMSDRFGRKPTIIFCAVGGVVGNLKTFVTSYYLYVAIEFLEAAVCGGTYASAMVLMIEIGGIKNRILSGVLFAYAVYFGETIFAFVAMLVPYWKTLVRVIYSPPILFITYTYLLRESPRWQILNGKTEKAKETLLAVAKMNDITIDERELKEADDIKLKNAFNIGKYEKKEGFKEIFTSVEILKRLLVASSCRFTASFVYYGLMVNSVSLPGNKYTNFMLATLMSFPGEILAMYLMNKIGRKLPLILGFMVCASLCIASAYLPESYMWTKIFLFLFGKMVVSVCFTGAVTYTMELFPTSARGSLLGLCAFSSSAGGMLAPLTPLLYSASAALPSICFAGATLVTAILITMTPETKGAPLMDTVQQVNAHANTVKENRRPIQKGLYNDGYSGVTAL